MSPPHASATPLLETTRYISREWDFALDYPAHWRIEFEDQADPPYMLPISVMGPRGLRGHPALTVQIAVVSAEGHSLDEYMHKAESDLRAMFPGFHPLRRWRQPLLGAPTAWMSYQYQGSSGPRQELNVTAFIGQARLLWLQFIAETDREDAPKDMPVLEAIIHSFRPGPTGIRVPHLVLTSVPACDLCGKRFAPRAKTNAVFNLESNRLTAICDDCRRHPE